MGVGSSILEGSEWEDTTADGLWAMTHGKLADHTEISHFRLAKQNSNHQNQEILRKLIKNLRSIRHPSILKYVCSEERSNGPELVTEKAIPLGAVLPSLSSTEICAGLHTILEALQFLHQNVGVSHNNIHVGSVYVTGDGSWKLGGLEHLCKFSEVTDAFLELSKPYRHESTITPEEKQGGVIADISLGHARDVFAFAVMTESLLEQMQDLGDLTKTFELRIQDECLHNNPQNRPQVSSLLSDRIFNTTFIEVALFLKNITLKSEEERHTFFKNLLPKLHSLPEELIARRLISSLLSRFVFMDKTAIKYLLPSVLTPGESPHSLFSETLYKLHVIPKLVKILSVHDYHIHVMLLQFFPNYVHLIDKEDLEFEVLPQFLLGLRDCSELISSLSLHGLAEMVPILGRDVVIGGKAKKYFKEGQPKTQNKDDSFLLQKKEANVHGVLAQMNQTGEEKIQVYDEKTALGTPFKSSESKLMLHTESPDLSNKKDTGNLPQTDKDFENIQQSKINHSSAGDMADKNDVWTGLREENKKNYFSNKMNIELTSMKTVSSFQHDDQKLLSYSTVKLGSNRHVQTVTKGDDNFYDVDYAKDNKCLTITSKGNIYANNQRKLGSEYDIMDLDIKVSTRQEDQFDFFEDMTPQIEKTKTISLDKLSDKKEDLLSTEMKTKFSMVLQDKSTDIQAGDGWDDDW